MLEKEKNTTRDKILTTAARMFAESEYDRVTMRKIAKDIGINPASIYYYFPSKEEILKSLYKLYSEGRRKLYPDLNALLTMAESEPPLVILDKSQYFYDDDVMNEFFNQILITATRRIYNDAESERFIRENMYDPIIGLMKPLLGRMMELGKIRKFDIDIFLEMLFCYCFGAASLMDSPFKQGLVRFRGALSSIYSFIVPVKES